MTLLDPPPQMSYYKEHKCLYGGSHRCVSTKLIFDQCNIEEIIMQNDVKTWELRELGSLSQFLMKRLINNCLFYNSFSPKP